jgi:diguanylate cyclase
MNYPEDATEAAEYLKKAVPLLVKHEIPANPVNYTLWYNYVGNRIPELNSALNRIIKFSGTCTPTQCQELYFHYIIGEHLEEHHKTLEGITKLAAHILQRLGKSTSSSAAFEQQLNKNISTLKEAKSVEDITTIVDNIISTSEDIRFANSVFQQQMNHATNEIASLRHQLQQAEKHAYIDQLTQLYNRHAFDRQLKQLIESDSVAKNVCLILADLDHFKSFNDDYGHIIGDRVLKRMGELVQDHCPDNAIGARYGGEEFAIIISNATQAQAAELAENLRVRLQQLRVKTKKSDQTLDNISASFGVACFEPGETLECFIDRTDQALYKAKHNGRNRVEVHCEDLVSG